MATLQSFGLQVEVRSFTSSYGTHYNVVATQTGVAYPNAYYVIGAHYDSAGTPGADDNASGVAGVMEIARILSTYRTDYTIKYMAFDMEEYGLYGSWAYASTHWTDDIRGMISMDMIAFKGGGYGCDLESVYGSSFPFRLAVQAAVYEYGNGLVPTLAPGYGGSDHYPFEIAGHPACLLIESSYESNPCYHLPCDSVDRPNYVDYAYACNMTRVVAGFLADHAVIHPEDCDNNGILDDLEILADPSLDCNGNHWLDICEQHGNEDCNNNASPDLCDVFTGASQDCDLNGVPDECQPDCNANGVADPCDLSDGTSADCDRNAVPDECQDTSADCNNNGIWDPCELGGLIYTENFGNGLPAGWTTSGLWHITDQCPRPNTCNATQWAYYGGDGSCDFNAGNTQGALTAAPITLPASALITLTYCSAYGGEAGGAPSGYDAAWLTVNGDLIDDISGDGQQLAWETRTVNLAAYAGETIVLAWRFDTQDHTVNQGLGWQVTSISINFAELYDCNHNLVPDACDIASGASLDRDANGLPDECEDCNANGISDNCELPGGCAVGNCADAPTCGASPDCNDNGTPDECGTDDNCPPADLHWLHPPTPISTTSITMEALATDPFGVQYYFNATGVNAHSRTWDAAPAYTDSGLQVNRNYTYAVKARDLSPLANETAYLSTSVATMIETPAALTFSNMTQTSIKVTAPGTFTRLSASQSGLYFEVTTLAGAPVGGPQANAWVKTQTITASGLAPGVPYRFRIKARNYYGQNETPWYPATGHLRMTLPYIATPLPAGVDDVDGQEVPRTP